MKNKITTLIIAFVIIGIIGIVFVFGAIVYQEINNVEVASSSQDFEENSYVVQDDKAKKDVEEIITTPEIVENPIDKMQSLNSYNNTEEVIQMQSNISIDKYLYNQLDEESKIIYRAFEANRENMKTGTYKINLGTSLSSVLSKSNGQELLGSFYQSAIEAYTYDNPDIFYLSPNKMYLNIETTTKGSNVTYNVFISNGEEANYLTNEFNSKEQVDAAVSQIEQVKNFVLKNKTGKAYDDIKMIHDYLVDTIEYDTSLSRSNIYNVYGALINKVCVCEGYARAFKYLLDGAGIQNVLVIGKATNSDGRTENHAWNYVWINNSWYAIDSTWDDPIVLGNGKVSQASRYKYFLKGSNEFNKDHIPSGQFTEGGKKFSYPTLSSVNYN